MSMTTANLEQALRAGPRVAILDVTVRRPRDPYFHQPAPLFIQSPSALFVHAATIGGPAVALLAILFEMLASLK
jgi:hypothetical protein